MPRIEFLEPETRRARAADHSRLTPSRDRLARRAVALCAALAGVLPGIALAQVKIGLVLSLTGPAASLGIPARDTVALLPKQIGGQSVEYIVLDDASDTTRAVQDTKKLISENHVDAIIGSSITPNS
ncbi:MAG: ABC transporter substrate-binding protein, partial [Paraburkholderia nemoris]